MPIEQQPRPSKRDLAYDYEDNKLLLKSEYQKSLHKLEQLQLNADERLEELYAEYVQLNGSANGLDTGGTQLTQFKGLKALTNKINGPKTVDVNTRLQTIRSQYIQLINVTNEIETYLDSAHSIAEFDSSQNPTFMSDVKALIDIKAQEKVEKNKVKEHHKKLKTALEIASTHKQKVARVAESVRGIPPMDVFAQTQTPPQPSLPSYLIDSTPPPSGRLSDEQLQKIINPNPEAKPFTLLTPTPESDITTLASNRLQNAELQTTKVEIIDKKSLVALASDEIKPVNPLIQKVIYNNTRGLEIGLDKDNKVIAFHTREGQSPVPLTFKFISNKIILSEPNPVFSYTVFNIQDRVKEQKAKVFVNSSQISPEVSTEAKIPQKPIPNKEIIPTPSKVNVKTKTDMAATLIKDDSISTSLENLTPTSETVDNVTTLVHITEEDKTKVKKLLNILRPGTAIKSIKINNIVGDKENKTVLINNIKTSIKMSKDDANILKELHEANQLNGLLVPDIVDSNKDIGQLKPLTADQVASTSISLQSILKSAEQQHPGAIINNIESFSVVIERPSKDSATKVNKIRINNIEVATSLTFDELRFLEKSFKNTSNFDTTFNDSFMNFKIQKLANLSGLSETAKKTQDKYDQLSSTSIEDLNDNEIKKLNFLFKLLGGESGLYNIKKLDIIDDISTPGMIEITVNYSTNDNPELREFDKNRYNIDPKLFYVAQKEFKKRSKKIPNIKSSNIDSPTSTIPAPIIKSETTNKEAKDVALESITQPKNELTDTDTTPPKEQATSIEQAATNIKTDGIDAEKTDLSELTIDSTNEFVNSEQFISITTKITNALSSKKLKKGRGIERINKPNNINEISIEVPVKSGPSLKILLKEILEIKEVQFIVDQIKSNNSNNLFLSYLAKQLYSTK